MGPFGVTILMKQYSTISTVRVSNKSNQLRAAWLNNRTYWDVAETNVNLELYCT